MAKVKKLSDQELLNKAKKGEISIDYLCDSVQKHMFNTCYEVTFVKRKFHIS